MQYYGVCDGTLHHDADPEHKQIPVRRTVVRTPVELRGGYVSYVMLGLQGQGRASIVTVFVGGV